MPNKVCEIVISPKQVSQKTYVVFGVARSGTSMVAGCLRELGIFMGDIVADNHEDSVFLSDDIEILKKVIWERNDKYDNWGWKVPKSIFHIENLLPFIRNPHFIMVTRDPFDIAKSMMKRQGMPFELAIQHIFMVYKSFQEFVERCIDPLIFVSYNRAIADKEVFIQELTSFIGCKNLSKEQLKQAHNFIATDYQSTSLDKQHLASLAQARLDNKNLNIINQIQQKSIRVLRLCKEEINTVESFMKEISALTINVHLQNTNQWEEGVQKIPEFKQLIDVLYQDILDKTSKIDIISTEERRQQCQALLKKIVAVRYTGNRLLYEYELNKKQ